MCRFPYKRVPHVNVFGTTLGYNIQQQGISGTGNLRREECVRPPADLDIEDEILRRFDEHKTRRTKDKSHRMGKHPFYHTLVQGLEEDDPVRRVAFGRYLLNPDLENPTFL